jgi:hypothetical protein
LKACDELLKAEAEGRIRLEQAAAICRYSKEDQKVIVKVIEDAISKGQILNGKDIDKFTKQLHETESDEEMDNTLLEARASMIIAGIIDSKKETEQTSDSESVEENDHKSTTIYDKYSLRLSQLKKDLEHNRIDDLKPAEVEKLMQDYDEIRKSLEKAHLFSELMSGLYKGSPVVNSTEIDADDLRSLNPLQLRKLTKAYDKAENLDNIVYQISTIEAEIAMTIKSL